ncbi:MAG: peptide/nickel transport system permease protein [Thermomicrobiales bacterium]|nr:peptide/nickel transport system permease protein [Thermomicrobiales bacterium]MEA2525067.1 peptide/nickel transport system permease protein [Thermomicrobiales bacterium]
MSQAQGIGTLAVPTASPVAFTGKSRWRQFLRQLVRSPKGLTGAILVGLAIFAAITASVVSPHDPTEQAVRGKFAKPALLGYESDYLLGGDNLGRDIFSRILYGSRASLAIGFLVTALAAVVGSILGGIAGFRGGLIDTAVMRLVDLQLSIPFILLALIFLAILGPGFWSVFVALAVALWVNYARLVRGETLTVREMEYVVAAETIGVSKTRTLLVHILPNVLPSILVLATLDMAFVIIFESSLTFLGLGIQPPTPTWGYMLSEGRNYLRESPWLSLFPGSAIILTVVGINVLGDWLRDTLDPSLRGR